MKGYVQIYTGNGKGKTTAAIGLSIRAVGAGLKVYFGQFVKVGEFSEIKALNRFSDQVTIEQFGMGPFIFEKPSPKEIKAAQNGLTSVKEALMSGQFDVVIMDEAITAIACGLLSEQKLLDVIKIKPQNVELIITGHNAGSRLIEIADLVTEMKNVKHYFDQGQIARNGIEK